jgi:poly-gamma-glutamate synthesis protein (capsule biosynthesis protein)
MARADVTIVMIHGGEEGVLCPSPFMLELEQTFASMGVDAVIDGHPHVLQGITKYGDTWAAHSLGNFAFPPAGGITGNSAIVQLVISEAGIDMRVEPIRSDRGVLSPPSSAQRAEIINQMQRVSDGVSIADDGSVTAAPSVTGSC